MYPILKYLLFLFPPETAHHITVKIFSLILKIPFLNTLIKKQFQYSDPALERNLMGLRFLNPVGLAAGFDKDGKYFKEMATLGFGFIEIGTVTPKAQSGNPKPRLFRLLKDNALINRMGFNNDGVDAMVRRLKNRKNTHVIIGGNIGKNKITPNENAVLDYVNCFEKLYPYVDYFTVNVSSPNTPGLRELQEKGPLLHILNKITEIRKTLGGNKPILLKIAPDLTESQLDDVVEIVQESGIEGIIATNTTTDRTGLHTDISKIGAGGLSGAPLKNRSNEIIRYIASKSEKKFCIVGVGGIESPEDAIEKLHAGADLIQIYTGLVYQGPGLIKKILKGLKRER